MSIKDMFVIAILSLVAGFGMWGCNVAHGSDEEVAVITENHLDSMLTGQPEINEVQKQEIVLETSTSEVLPEQELKPIAEVSSTIASDVQQISTDNTDSLNNNDQNLDKVIN